MTKVLVDVPPEEAENPRMNKFFLSTHITQEEGLEEYIGFCLVMGEPRALKLKLVGEVDNLDDKEIERWQGFIFKNGNFHSKIEELQKIDRIAEEGEVISNGKKWEVGASHDLEKEEGEKILELVNTIYQNRKTPEQMTGFSSSFDAYISTLTGKYEIKLS